MSKYLLFLILIITNTVSAQTYMRLPVINIYDGDTIESRLNRLPKPLNKIYIRLSGIDTPEMPAKSYAKTGKLGRAKCKKEAELALQAKQFVQDTLKHKYSIIVYDYRWGRYGGRILARVYLGGGQWLNDLLIQKGYAVPYDGTGPKHDWCN